eukprot:sb/3471122/
MLGFLFVVTVALATVYSADNDALISVQSGSIVNLNKQLEVGDEIVAYGVYADGTIKFSVNILSADYNLLHVDFRPYIGEVVLNSYGAYGWETELRAYPAASNFVDGKVFQAKIVVEEECYRVYLNGVQLGTTFPHRYPISTANRVSLWEGSNGFQWSALQLPPGSASPGVPMVIESGMIVGHWKDQLEGE